jgi:hypothetical protein
MELLRQIYIIFAMTWEVMQDHKSIDQQRYRSAALGHAYILAKRNGVALKALPEGILKDLGISVRNPDGMCTVFEVKMPENMGDGILQSKVEAFEREFRREMPARIQKSKGKKAIMPESWPGKDDIGRAQAWAGETRPPMDDGIRDVLDQYGDRRSAAMGRKGLDG